MGTSLVRTWPLLGQQFDAKVNSFYPEPLYKLWDLFPPWKNLLQSWFFNSNTEASLIFSLPGFQSLLIGSCTKPILVFQQFGQFKVLSLKKLAFFFFFVLLSIIPAKRLTNISGQTSTIIFQQASRTALSSRTLFEGNILYLHCPIDSLVTKSHHI